MKQLTAEQLRRHALGVGAELVIGGQPFNSSREQVDLAPPRPQRAPPPPPPPETFSRAEVERMLERQATALRRELADQMAGVVQQAASRPGERVVALVPTVGPDGAFTRVTLEYGPA